MSMPSFSTPGSRSRKAASAAMHALQRSVRDALRVRSRRRGRRQKAKMYRARGNEQAVWEVLATMLLRFGGATAGNCVELFHDGDRAFEAIWEAIDQAKRRVWLETYILEPDRVGQRTIEALAAAARRGCQVRLLFDSIGSPRATATFLQPLRDAATEVQAGLVEIDSFNPVFTWRRRPGFLQRDHRKIVIVDDDVAFCGGMNVSEDYAGEKYGKGTFADCHARLSGPCVRDLANVMLESLKLVRDIPREPPRRRCGRSGTSFVQVMSSRGKFGRRSIQRAIRLTARYSVNRCWITTPYFLPPRRLMKAMIRAAQRGVDVRVLTAGVSDVPMVRLASQHIYGELLSQRVRIFEYFDATLHAKTMVIDGLFSSIGSFNLDTWSHERNLEVKVAVIGREIAESMEREFERHLEGAKEVLLDHWKKRTRWQRFVQWLSYQAMRL